MKHGTMNEIENGWRNAASGWSPGSVAVLESFVAMSSGKEIPMLNRVVYRGGRLASFVLATVLLLSPSGGGVAVRGADEVASALQKGLVEEEANQDLQAAIRAYQAALDSYGNQRKAAATALVRLAECYRKLGQTNDAVAAYRRVITDFADQAKLVELSQQHLARTFGEGGGKVASEEDPAAKQKALLAEEMALVNEQLRIQQLQFQSGRGSQEDGIKLRRELLGLQRQLAALEMRKTKPELLTVLGADGNAAGAQGQPADPGGEDAKEIARLQAMIANSPDLLNAPSDKELGRLTPLQDAASSGRLSVVRFLLEKGTRVDEKGTRNLAPLHFAAAKGHRAVVDLLLAKGADVNGTGSGGITALHLAAANGHVAVAETLLAAKPNLRSALVDSTAVYSLGANNAFSPAVGETALHAAVKKGSELVVELLARAGADPNQGDAAGATPLHLAARLANLAVVKSLLGAKGAVGARDRNGVTPLQVAIGAGQLEASRLLLEAGADVNAESDEGVRPVQSAILSGKPELLRLVLGAKPDLTRGSKDGKKPLLLLWWTLHWNQSDLPGVEGRGLRHDVATEMLRDLLDAGVDADEVPPEGGNGQRPLHLAVVRCLQGAPLELVRLLLARKPQVDARDRDGYTALQLAVVQNPESMGVVDALLDAGSDVNDTYVGTGDSLLHIAVELRNFALVKTLIAHGARVNPLNNRGTSPFAALLARMQGFGRGGSDWVRANEIAKVLKDAGADEYFHLRSAISIRRNGGQPLAVIRCDGGTNNAFSLLEVLAWHYGGNGRLDPSTTRDWQFPDFSKLTISRLGDSGRTELKLDLPALMATSGEKADVPLQWGDILDIPEGDHPVSALWRGLDEALLRQMASALSRRVSIVLHGKTTNTMTLSVTNRQATDSGLQLDGRLAELAPTPEAFYLRGCVQASGLVRSSSDLSKVQVRRVDPVTGAELVYRVNLTLPSTSGYDTGANRLNRPGMALPPRMAAPVPGPNAFPQPLGAPGAPPATSIQRAEVEKQTAPFWLRDGDVIEIPEKSAEERAKAASVQPVAP